MSQVEWRDIFRRTLGAHGWTKARLAKETGISADTIDNWYGRQDSSRQHDPKISSAIRVAEVTGLSLDELFRGISYVDRLERMVRAEVARQLEQELDARKRKGGGKSE